jgi:tRNASer (uridine44-2'-O)-methyltransferase
MASQAGPNTQHRVTAEDPFTRPPYKPTVNPADYISPLSTSSAKWIEPLSIPVHFTLSSFLAASKDLALHPERNSTLILRADPLPPPDQYDGPEGNTYDVERTEEFKLRLMPKMPARDGKLDQRVVFFRGGDEPGGEKGENGLVLSIPEVKEVKDIPYFHPPVRKLAYRYESLPASLDVVEGESEAGPSYKGTMSIAYLPFDDISSTTPISTDPYLTTRPVKPPRKRSPLAATASPDEVTSNLSGMNLNGLNDEAILKAQKVTIDRLHRTCLAILEKVWKHAYGNMVGYQKRVQHDVRLLPLHRHDLTGSPQGTCSERVFPGSLPSSQE